MIANAPKFNIIMMTNFKKHAMALVALAIAATSATLMSFNKVEKQASNWYPVSGTTITSSTPLATAPSNDPEEACSTSKTADMCAIQLVLNPANPFPSSVAQAQANHTVLEEAFSRLQD